MKKLSVIFLIILASFGCHKTLEPGGAYAPTNTVPDMAFYVSDAAFSAAQASLDAAFTWERQNRLFLWSVSPAIKHGLDKIRPDATTAVKDYLIAREAYRAHPTPAGLDKLTTILTKLQQIQGAAWAVSTNNIPKAK